MMSKGGLRLWIDSLWQRPMLLLVVGLSLATFAGCGSSMKNTTPAITFASGELAPPSSVMASSTVQFAANVTNDSANAGVSWMVSCDSANAADCGSISRHTASGTPSAYIAPLKVPASGSVTITANASTDPKQSVSAKVKITPIVYGPITVTFPDSTPTSVMAGAIATFSPVVTNDHLNDDGTPMGVTLTATCSDASGMCGTVQGTAYTAPSVAPSGGLVTITAVSNADSTKKATTTITITPAVIGVTLSQLPASVPAGMATNVNATVSNDLSKKGVDWSASCVGGGSGGSLNPVHTAPKVPSLAMLYPTQVASYATPASGCPSNQVTITATPTADPTRAASVTMQVTPVEVRNDLLKGQYAFLLSGTNLGASALAGSLIADGNGNIVSAQESQPGKGANSLLSNISGTYFVGADGRGTITLSGLPFDIYGGWNNGQQVFKIAVVSSTHVLAEEFDGYGEYPLGTATPPRYGATLVGALDLQNPADFAARPIGPYSFIMGGGSGSLGVGYYYGGALTANVAGTVTNFTMDRYYPDQNYQGITDCIASNTSSGCASAKLGTFTAIDSYGHGTVAIGPYSFDYYMVDSEHLILSAKTSSDRTGYPAGRMYAQGTADAITGSYAFTMAGSMPLPNNTGGTAPLAMGGQFSCDATGNLTGYLDTNSDGGVEMASVTGTCATPDGNGRGKLTMNGGGASQFALYPTADSGLLLFQLDPKKSSVGVAFPQSTSPVRTSTFQGNYAASFQCLGVFDPSKPQTGSGLALGTWFDFVGQIAADGSFGFSAKIDVDRINGSYTSSLNNFWMQMPDVNMTGNFAVSPQPARFTGSIDAGTAIFADLTDFRNYNSIMPQIFYVVDDNTVLSLESGATPGTGILQKQQF